MWLQCVLRQSCDRGNYGLVPDWGEGGDMGERERE